MISIWWLAIGVNGDGQMGRKCTKGLIFEKKLTGETNSWVGQGQVEKIRES